MIVYTGENNLIQLLNNPLNIDSLDIIDPDSNLFNGIHANIDSSLQSKLQTIDEYNTSTIFSPNSCLSILNHNIRSLNCNGDSFIGFINTIQHQPDVIVLTETWLSDDNKSIYNIEGFTAYHTIRNTRGGGVSIYCSNTLKSTIISSLTLCNETIESCGIKITYHNEQYNIIAIYRPHTDTIENFTYKLNDILNTTNIRKQNVIVAGDININLLQPDRTTQLFMNTMQSLHYIPVITKPTRHSPNEAIVPTLLDQIWMNKLTEYHSAIIITDLTDHYPTILNLPVSQNKTEKIKLTFRSHKPEYIDQLKNKLNDWNNLFNMTSDTDERFTQLTENINRLYCATCPVQIKYVSIKRLQSPWLTKGILHSIKRKSFFHKLTKLGVMDQELNKKYKNTLTNLIRKSKEEYYQSKFQSCKNNIKNCWKLIKKILGRDNNKINNISLMQDGKEITDHKDIAEIFCSYFSSIATSLDNNIPICNKSPLDYLQNPTPNSIFMTPLLTLECKTIIKSLKNSSYGYNSLPTRILKQLDNLTEPITFLINEAVKQCVFPQILKKGIITPIFKDGDNKQVSNYRPITVLPLLSKIFERYIASRLTTYFDKYSIISPQQYGFQKGRSTTDAMINLTEHIYSALNDRQHNCTVLIDFKKAFDTVNHEILIKKLHHYGIRGDPLKLLTSYLYNRKQAVKISSTISNEKTVTIGVPQGSVLGPLLFLLYVNDLPNASQRLKSILFADDTTLSMNGHNHENLIANVNTELDTIKDWTQANRLSLNLTKTYELTFSNRKHDLTQTAVIMNGEKVKHVQDTKLLGVTIDNNLTFEQHITNISNKISKSIGIMYKIKNQVPKSVLITIYYSFIYPYLIYGNEIWGGTNDCYIKPLILLQKKIVRIITGSDYLAHTNPLFNKTNILKLTDIHKHMIATRIYKMKGSNAVNRHRHNYYTRNANDLLPTYQRLTMTQRTLSHKGPRLWNTIPSDIQISKNTSQFKIRYKKFLINTYTE